MPVNRLTYQEPQPISRDEACSALATNKPEVICSMLVSLALHDSDWRWVQDKCLEFARHPDARVRQVAATCIGHVARIHRTLDLDAVTPVLHQLLSDTEGYVKGCAEDAMDDIQVFMGVDLKRRSSDTV
jgi:hypothetical protein